VVCFASAISSLHLVGLPERRLATAAVFFGRCTAIVVAVL
jgi:hypothetical protein